MFPLHWYQQRKTPALAHDNFKKSFLYVSSPLAPTEKAAPSPPPSLLPCYTSIGPKPRWHPAHVHWIPTISIQHDAFRQVHAHNWHSNSLSGSVSAQYFEGLRVKLFVKFRVSGMSTEVRFGRFSDISNVHQTPSPRMPHTLGEIFTHAQLLDFKNRNS